MRSDTSRLRPATGLRPGDGQRAHPASAPNAAEPASPADPPVAAETAPLPEFVVRVFADLQRLQLDLGVDDLLELRTALRVGFGLRSDRALVELCVALWATTPGEAESVRAVFARHIPPWEAAATGQAPPPPPDPQPGEHQETSGAEFAESSRAPALVPAPPSSTGPGELPPLPSLVATGRQIVFEPQFPLTRRAIAQAFRRLRRPVPSGPPTQLDIEATVERRSRSGVVTPPVLVPRRRNAARLLILVDRQGSMVPFHPYTDHICASITGDSGLGAVEIAYFHDTPVDEPDSRLLRRLSRLKPQLDPILAEVRESLDGLVYADPGMVTPRLLADVVEGVGDAAVVVLSDAGAARGGVDPARNLASVAFAKAVRLRGMRAVWLNPVPRQAWAGASAGLLARHVPMLELDPDGLHRAVDVLRGRPIALERAA